MLGFAFLKNKKFMEWDEYKQKIEFIDLFYLFYFQQSCRKSFLNH